MRERKISSKLWWVMESECAVREWILELKLLMDIEKKKEKKKMKAFGSSWICWLKVICKYRWIILENERVRVDKFED